jgi:hypothetical protein
MADPTMTGAAPASAGASRPEAQELLTAQLDAASAAFLDEVRERWNRSGRVLAGTALTAFVSPLVALMAGAMLWSSTMGAWFAPGFFDAPNFWVWGITTAAVSFVLPFSIAVGFNARFATNWYDAPSIVVFRHCNEPRLNSAPKRVLRNMSSASDMCSPWRIGCSRCPSWGACRS